MRARYWGLIGLIVAIVIIGSVASYFMTRPDLQISQDPVQGSSLMVNRVFLDRPGYVVVHEAGTGGNATAEAVVGTSTLINGEQTNLTVPISDGATQPTTLAVALHYDNGDGVFSPTQDTEMALLPGDARVITVTDDGAGGTGAVTNGTSGSPQGNATGAGGGNMTGVNGTAGGNATANTTLNGTVNYTSPFGGF